jgi:hypothetical protein
MGIPGNPALERVVWPRSRRTVETAALARRSTTLAGKTIAFLWDDVFRGDEVFALLAHELRRRFPGVRFVGHETFGATFGGDEHRTIAGLPETLRDRGVDAVVSGMGC